MQVLVMKSLSCMVHHSLSGGGAVLSTTGEIHRNRIPQSNVPRFSVLLTMPEKCAKIIRDGLGVELHELLRKCVLNKIKTALLISKKYFPSLKMRLHTSMNILTQMLKLQKISAMNPFDAIHKNNSAFRCTLHQCTVQ